MPFTALVPGDVELIKDILPPGTPGTPGTSGTPGWDETVTVTVPPEPPPVGMTYVLVSQDMPTAELGGLPAVTVVFAPEQDYTQYNYDGSTTPESSGVQAGSTYTTIIHHPAIPGTPGTPAIPGDPTGWNAWASKVTHLPDGSTYNTIYRDGIASFYGDVNSVGAIVGLTIDGDTGGAPERIGYGFRMERGELTILDNFLTLPVGAFADTDYLSIHVDDFVVSFWQNTTLLHTSAIVQSQFWYMAVLLYAFGDRIMNATLTQYRPVRSTGVMAPLVANRGGRMAPLILLNGGNFNHANSAAQLSPLFGIGADVPSYAWSTSGLSPMVARAVDSEYDPGYNSSRGVLPLLTGAARGSPPNHASSSSFLAPMSSVGSDKPDYSYGAGQLFPLRMRAGSPFLHLMIANSLGGATSMSSDFRLIGMIGASGGVSMLFTVNISTLATIASSLGISDAYSLRTLIYQLIQARLGMSTEPMLEDSPDLLDVWVVNVDTNGTTRYEDFDFNSFALVGGRYFGAREDGIFALEGDDDAGQPIRASINFGKHDFGTSKEKRVPNAYMGAASDGTLIMKVIVDGNEYLYSANNPTATMETQRFDFGKGLKANFFEFELYNQDGEDFEVDEIEFVPIVLSRRI